MFPWGERAKGGNPLSKTFTLLQTCPRCARSSPRHPIETRSANRLDMIISEAGVTLTLILYLFLLNLL